MSYIIPAGVIAIWPGTNASIPSGWERETSLDGRYPKGTADATDPGDTGGAATHTHSATANHSHTMASHTHVLTAGNSYNGTEGTSEDSDSTIRAPHSHTGSTTSTTGGGLSSVATTYAAVSNDPPYYEVIFIKSTGTQDGLPDDAIALSRDTSFDSNNGNWVGMYQCDGNNGTPDMTGRYFKGAATSGNGGGTGGSTTNTHTLTHTHTVAAHYHSGLLNASTAGRGDSDNDSNDNPHYQHTHSVTTNSVTDTLADSPSVVTTETVEPAYTELLPIQNLSGSNLLPVGTICLWLGTLANIPAGWKLCDGTESTIDMRGKYQKTATSAATVGNNGGSNTHSHASQTHTHTVSASHSHSFTITSHSGAVDRGGTTAFIIIQTNDGRHDVTSDSISSTYSSDSTAASSSSNEPPYITVAFIEYLGVWTVDVDENVDASENTNVALAHTVSVSDTTNAEEDRLEANVRAGGDINVSIWTENVNAEDLPTLPGDRSRYIIETTVTVSEEVTVKIISLEDASQKPSFKVSI